MTEFRVIEARPMSPRFIYVGSAQAAAPFDVTWVIVAVIAVSMAVASVWLFIGAKEYGFFELKPALFQLQGDAGKS